MFIIFCFPQNSPLCLVNVSYFRFREHFNKLLTCKSSYEEPFLVRGNHKNDWKGPNIDIKRNNFLINEKGALNIEIWRKQIINLLLISPKCGKWRGKYVFFLKITSRITITHLTDFCWSSTFPGSLNEFTVSSQSLLLL